MVWGKKFGLEVAGMVWWGTSVVISEIIRQRICVIRGTVPQVRMLITSWSRVIFATQLSLKIVELFRLESNGGAIMTS